MKIPRYIFVILAIIFMLLLIRIFIIGSYRIEGDHVDSVLKKGDCVWVNKLKYKGYPPEGGLVLYKSPLRRDTKKPPMFVGRCMGIPGDTITATNKGMYINGKLIPQVSLPQQVYRLRKEIKEQLYATMESLHIPLHEIQEDSTSIILQMSSQEHELLCRNLSKIVNMESSENHEFAYYTFIIPKKRHPVRVCDALDIYQEAIIREFGEKRISFKDGNLLIDGIKHTSIRFTHDYYWILSEDGDGIDSRHLGLIPKNHLIGHMWFCWYSKESSRCFHAIR